MAEYRFHHLERRRVDQALPDLLERALEEGRRAVVRVSSEEMVAALNDRLWTYDDASFLPHGSEGDGEEDSHPVFLTTRTENPSGATLLVRLSGAGASPEDEVFSEIVLLFDGRDQEAVAEARAQWKRLKNEGRVLSYWREADDGGWERAR